jgi:Transposase DDE domain group 1
MLSPHLRWPAVEIVVRGDNYSTVPEAMAWCERSGSATSRPLWQSGIAAKGQPVGRGRRLGRLAGDSEKVRGCGDSRSAANRLGFERRVIARVKAGPLKVPAGDLSSPTSGVCPRRSMKKVDGVRGPAEYLIKALRLNLASDRNRLPQGDRNQFLLLHTAGYWLMLRLRGPAQRPPSGAVPRSIR